jgi:hypothetical protein
MKCDRKGPSASVHRPKKESKKPTLALLRPNEKTPRALSAQTVHYGRCHVHFGRLPRDTALLAAQKSKKTCGADEAASAAFLRAPDTLCAQLNESCCLFTARCADLSQAYECVSVRPRGETFGNQFRDFVCYLFIRASLRHQSASGMRPARLLNGAEVLSKACLILCSHDHFHQQTEERRESKAISETIARPKARS